MDLLEEKKKTEQETEESESEYEASSSEEEEITLPDRLRRAETILSQVCLWHWLSVWHCTWYTYVFLFLLNRKQDKSIICLLYILNVFKHVCCCVCMCACIHSGRRGSPWCWTCWQTRPISKLSSAPLRASASNASTQSTLASANCAPKPIKIVCRCIT